MLKAHVSECFSMLKDAGTFLEDGSSVDLHNRLFDVLILFAVTHHENLAGNVSVSKFWVFVVGESQDERVVLCINLWALVMTYGRQYYRILDRKLIF